jgi:hypothetical protein
LVPAWLTLVLIGYTLMYRAFGFEDWQAAFTVSGSSLLTLGFSMVKDVPTTILAFSEAAIGLILIALLIAYLPTIYSAFSRREAVVTLLEVRAGNNGSPMSKNRIPHSLLWHSSARHNRIAHGSRRQERYSTRRRWYRQRWMCRVMCRQN